MCTWHLLTQPAAVIFKARSTHCKSESLRDISWKGFCPHEAFDEAETNVKRKTMLIQEKGKINKHQTFFYSRCIHPRLMMMWLCRKFLYSSFNVSLILSFSYTTWFSYQQNVVALLMETDTRRHFKVPWDKPEGSEGSNDSGGCRWKITQNIACDEISGE